MRLAIPKTIGALIGAAALASAAQAQASSAEWGYISYITPASNGFVYFQSSGARTALPACADSSPNLAKRWAIDITTPSGQAQLATLLSAFGTKQPIYIYGLGTCPTSDPTEKVSFFHLGQ